MLTFVKHPASLEITIELKTSLPAFAGWKKCEKEPKGEGKDQGCLRNNFCTVHTFFRVGSSQTIYFQIFCTSSPVMGTENAIHTYYPSGNHIGYLLFVINIFFKTDEVSVFYSLSEFTPNLPKRQLRF